MLDIDFPLWCFVSRIGKALSEPLTNPNIIKNWMLAIESGPFVYSKLPINATKMQIVTKAIQVVSFIGFMSPNSLFYRCVCPYWVGNSISMLIVERPLWVESGRPSSSKRGIFFFATSVRYRPKADIRYVWRLWGRRFKSFQTRQIKNIHLKWSWPLPHYLILLLDREQQENSSRCMLYEKFSGNECAV